MNRLETPKGLRLHIGIFGRRNSGKSTLMNALVGQQISIVSAEPGTTTDPVEKTFELAPLGPVVFIDTAGFDDSGQAGMVQARSLAHRLLPALHRRGVGGLHTRQHQHQVLAAARVRHPPGHRAFALAQQPQQLHAAEPAHGLRSGRR